MSSIKTRCPKPVFLAFLQRWLANEQGIKDFEKFKAEHKIDEWLHGLEIPSNAPTFESKLVDEINVQKQKVLKEEEVDIETLESWNLSTRMNFLHFLTGSTTADQLALLDSQMHFTDSKTMSIREEWAVCCATAGYLTPKTQQMIANYLYERNSAHRANLIATALSKTAEGREAIQFILNNDNGRLFR